MMKSLVLYKDEKIIFSSEQPGLRPLVECINHCKRGDKIFDKVIGLAAARLIVHSCIADSVITPLISKPALIFLKRKKIKVKAEQIVDNILTKDKKDICPMEKKALSIENDEEFFKEILGKFTSC